MNDLNLQNSNLYSFFEMSLSDLLTFKFASNRSTADIFYLEVLKYYNSAETEKLKLLIDNFEAKLNSSYGCFTSENLFNESVLWVAKLRLLCLEKQRLVETPTQEILKWLNENKIENLVIDPYLGEYFFIVARILDLKYENDFAYLYYKKAEISYAKNKLLKKSAKSFFNSLICKNRNENSDTLQYEYIKFINVGRKIKEFSAVGMAFLALSQKLYDIGSVRNSLAYVNRALAYLSNEKGSNNYFKALLHRSLVASKLGDNDKYLLDREESSLSQHIETKPMLEVSNSSIKNNKIIDSSILPISWQKRSIHNGKLTFEWNQQEEYLLAILLKKPTNKFTLISKLWPQLGINESTELRFKKIIWKVRNKNSKLIIYSNNLYSIGELSLKPIKNEESNLSNPESVYD